MLIRFEVSNFRSIREPIELSMVAIDRDRDAARDAPMLGESLLTVAGLYGPNASGKSNVVAAVGWLVEAVRTSLHLWDDGIPVEPFAFAPQPHGSTEFAVDMLIDGVRYEYLLELDTNEIQYEGLFHYPEKKRRRLLEREGASLKLQRGLGKLSGTRELLTERSMAASIVRRFDEPVVTKFVEALLRVQPPYPYRSTWTGRTQTSPHDLTRQIFERALEEQGSVLDREDAERRTRALAMLRLADLGIEDVQFDLGEYGPHMRRLQLLHRAGDRSAPLDFGQESEGTRAWFDLIGLVLSVLGTGSILAMDELDASLHPTLCAQVIRLFQHPDINPRGAQLVFTSHDTSLLEHLNRDEVWFTEKSEDGATRLRALADFGSERVRRSRNLETGYLHGRFGALPNVDQSALLRAFGLVG